MIVAFEHIMILQTKRQGWLILSLIGRNWRNQAKKDKNYARADEIRNELKAKGIVIIDTPNGTTWKYE